MHVVSTYENHLKLKYMSPGALYILSSVLRSAPPSLLSLLLLVIFHSIQQIEHDLLLRLQRLAVYSYVRTEKKHIERDTTVVG